MLLSASAALVISWAVRVRERRSIETVAAEKDFAETQRRNSALLDAYGDRSSLEELERAKRFYEKKNIK